MPQAVWEFIFAIALKVKLFIAVFPKICSKQRLQKTGDHQGYIFLFEAS
jgi:hypothetical protein